MPDIWCAPKDKRRTPTAFRLEAWPSPDGFLGPFCRRPKEKATGKKGKRQKKHEAMGRNDPFWTQTGISQQGKHAFNHSLAWVRFRVCLSVLEDLRKPSPVWRVVHACALLAAIWVCLVLVDLGFPCGFPLKPQGGTNSKERHHALRPTFLPPYFLASISPANYPTKKHPELPARNSPPSHGRVCFFLPPLKARSSQASFPRSRKPNTRREEAADAASPSRGEPRGGSGPRAKVPRKFRAKAKAQLSATKPASCGVSCSHACLSKIDRETRKWWVGGGGGLGGGF